MRFLLVILLALFAAAAPARAQVLSTSPPTNEDMELLGVGTTFFTANPTPLRAALEVPNMAALRAFDITGLENGASIRLLGYYSPGDGGGGDYVITNTVSGTNAFGGRILANGGAKSWDLVKENNRISAKQFGAVGDGTADDLIPLNQLITFQTNNWQNTWAYVEPGVYKVTNPVVFGSNARIIGVPKQSIFRRAWNQIDGEGKRMAIMRNLSWEGLTNGITYERDTNIWIEGLMFQNPYNPGSTTNALYQGGGFACYYVRDLVFKDCTSENSEKDWNLTFWGNNLTIWNPTTIGSRDVFEDGVHFLGGTNILMIGGDIECGDDAVAFTSNYNTLLAQAGVYGVRTKSWRGHAFRVSPETTWTGPVTETNYIGDIVAVGFTGSAGLLKNGAIQIREYPVTSTPLRMLKNISVRDFRINMGDMTGRTDSQIASWPVSVGGATNILIDNVRCWPSYKDNCYIEYSQDVLVQNSYFDSPYETNDVAVDVVGSDRVRLINNTIVNTNGNNSVVFRQGGTDWRLIENNITAGTSGVFGVRFFNAGTELSRVIGNTFYGPGGGVQLSLANMASLTVLDNRFDSSVGTEVQLNGSSVPTSYIVSNNDGYIYPTPVTQLWAENTGSATILSRLVRSDVSATNYTTIAASQLRQYGNTLFGVVYSQSDTNSVDKSWYYASGHYTTTEEPLGLIRGASTSTAGTVQVGGGSSLVNAATSVQIYSANDNITQTGTEVARFDFNSAPANRDSAFQLLDRDAGTLRRVGVTNLDVGDGVTRSYLYLK